MFYESKIVSIPQQPNSQKTIGFGLLCVLLAGLFFLYLWIIDFSANLEEQNAKQIKEIVSLTNNKENLNQVLGRYEFLIDQFDKALFKEKDTSLFLSGISEISRKHDVNVVSIRNLQEQTIEIADEDLTRKKDSSLFRQDRLSKIIVSPFDVQIDGEVENVLLVLLALERTPQMLAISQFEFKLRKYPRINVKFQLNLYGAWREGDR